MRNNLFLLLGVIVLYLAPAMVLKTTYGESYSMWQDENDWVPDGAGGWRQNGQPSDPMPLESSVEVPIAISYLPIFLPALLLVLFLFTPLNKYIESKPSGKEKEENQNVEE
ncbi:MAG: hypothetical protein U9N54_12815 [candidate division Zixibacteria bacterium]|nr:hypothetical protein [candidate division Zixibacteria bacterium]